VQRRCHLPALLRAAQAADDRGVAVEVPGDLLEGGVAGLDVEPPDDGELDGQPGAVEDVVLPADVVERDGVDVLVEEDYLLT